MICTVEGCTSVIKSGNRFCEKHRARFRRHGNPNVVLKDHTPATERWKTSYEVDPETGCWNWTGPFSRGYGFIQDGARKRYQAHRFVYEQVVGPIPDGKEIDHVCRNTKCVNPDPGHCEPVTHAVNVQRGNAGIANALKTHCKRGHEFTPENTYDNHGHRGCRECQRTQVREYMREKRRRERIIKAKQFLEREGEL